MKKQQPTVYLAEIAMLSAVAYMVMFLSKQIPVNVAGFLNFDLKDVIIGIAGFIFGPLSAALISVIVSLIEALTISSTAHWGFLMNVLSTCSFVCTASYIYKKRRTIYGALTGLIIGALFMTAVMLLWNYLITPIYMGQPREAVATMLIPVFLPFNLIKAGINGTLMFLLYKPIIGALRKARLVAASEHNDAPATRGRRLGIVLVVLVVLVTFILLALVLADVI